MEAGEIMNEVQKILISATNKKGLKILLYLNGKKYSIYGKKKGNKFNQSVSLIVSEDVKIKFNIQGEIIDNTFSSDELKLSITLSQDDNSKIIDITPQPEPEPEPETQTEWEELI